MVGVSQTGRRVPVSERALAQRINRRLARDGQMLKSRRGRRWRSDLGQYYIVNADRDFIVATRIDPEGYGRKLGVLADWEALEGAEAGEA